MDHNSDELDRQVLADLSTRTLVNGVGIDPALIGTALNLDARSVQQAIDSLQRRGLVRVVEYGVTITPEGHALLA